ncbi:MAG: hypothetical protein L0Y72_08105 [Gemmataceae bacterium]|nr:hypothetical protein [Gemmataceae bacterium]MCI0738991.1 hypothetical protein [Gemmataceae bacterium]
MRLQGNDANPEWQMVRRGFALMYWGLVAPIPWFVAVFFVVLAGIVFSQMPIGPWLSLCVYLFVGVLAAGFVYLIGQGLCCSAPVPGQRLARVSLGLLGAALAFAALLLALVWVGKAPVFVRAEPNAHLQIFAWLAFVSTLATGIGGLWFFVRFVQAVAVSLGSEATAKVARSYAIGLSVLAALHLVRAMAALFPLYGILYEIFTLAQAFFFFAHLYFYVWHLLLLGLVREAMEKATAP